jgi:hypothetical protein
MRTYKITPDAYQIGEIDRGFNSITVDTQCALIVPAVDAIVGIIRLVKRRA